jgi:sulfite reductase beta subunit-like hemoprotein
MANKLSEVAFVGKAPGTYLMLLGGGYYGQRLNKIYRGWANLLLLYPISSLIPFILRRERDRARDPGHSQADDQTLCS